MHGARLYLAVVGACSFGLASVDEAEAAPCAPPTIVTVLDKSSSMVTGTVNGKLKWDLARESLGAVLTTYQSNAAMGLMTFPSPNKCSPGAMVVDPALQQASAIATALGTPPPEEGSYTPIGQSLQALLSSSAFAQATGGKYAILITDGWQWCSPYNPADRFLGVDAVEDLRAAGITTFVIGFGSEVDVLAMTRMAVAAGTAPLDCNTNAETATDDNLCYFQVSEGDDLAAVLDRIVVEVATKEICDGKDNNCDGQIDEALVRACSSACGSGSEACTNGQWVGCSAKLPEFEKCDGADNDCNGATDEGCPCDAGAPAESCGISPRGVCKLGVQTCTAEGIWSGCKGDIAPQLETCDELDNDCDGITDEYDLSIVGTTVNPPLCEPGYICQGGTCVEGEARAPDEKGFIQSDNVGGCTCRTAGPASWQWQFALAVLACGWWLRRRAG